MCSIKFTTRSIVWGTIFEFIYILSAIYTVWFFNRNTPHDENTDKFRKKMLFKYILYISASVIMFLSIGITGIASLLAKTTKNQAGLVASEIISDISSTAGPVILCFGRLAHPKIKDKLLGLFGEDFRKRSSTSKKISK
jgi:1-phosphatidylinositol-4-phosphate 5-kinase